MKQIIKAVSYRKTVVPSDAKIVSGILNSAGIFGSAETDLAVEFVEDRLKDGEESGYSFLFLEIEGRTVGYGCYGKLPLTMRNWELYWIAVEDSFRGNGLGKMLLARIETEIQNHKGEGIYIETSAKEQYFPTRKFYERSGYEQVALFNNYYDHDDHKVVYYKKLN